MKTVRMSDAAILLRRLIVPVLLIVLSGSRLQAQEKEEEEAEQPWNLSLSANYLSRFTRLGVDLGQDQPALSVAGGVTHMSGVGMGAEAINTLGTNGGYEQSSFHLGYQRSIGMGVTLSGLYTYYSYKSDTLSPLSALSSTIALGASIDLKVITLSASYNAFFGGGSANFLSVGASSVIHLGELEVDPSVQAGFVSQSLDIGLLPKNRGKGLGKGGGKKGASATTTTITGLSDLTLAVGFSYPLGNGFSATLTPSYVYSPTDLAARSSQLLFTGGISYSLDF